MNDTKEVSYRAQTVVTGRHKWACRVYVVYCDGKIKNAYCSIMGKRVQLRKDGAVWRASGR